jgi:hypothetical protein
MPLDSDTRSATDVTPQWYGSAEVLQHRAYAKPLVSCSQKLAGFPHFFIRFDDQ